MALVVRELVTSLGFKTDAAKIRLFDRKINKLIKKLDAVSKKATKAGKTLTARLTAPIIGLGTAGALSFSKLEKGLVNVNNLLSVTELEKYREELKKLQEQSVKNGFTIEDTNQALFDTISALGASDNALKAFEVAQELAVAGNADLAVSVDGITSIMNAYGKELTDANEVANTFFSAQVKGKTTVSALAANVGKIAPIARAAGVGFKEIVATLSILTTSGLSTEEATTALRSAISSLIKPGKESAKILKRLKIPFGAAKIEALGLTEVLKRLRTAQNKYGTDLIAKAIPNVRAFTAVVSLNDNQLDAIGETVRKITEDTSGPDGMSRAFKDMSDTLDRRFKRAVGRSKIALSAVFEQFKPDIIIILDKITKLLDRFNSLSPALKRTVGVFALLLASLGPILIGLGLMIKAFSLMLIPLKLIFGIFTLIKVAILAAFGPVGLIVAALVGLVAISVLVFKNWDKIKGLFGDIGSLIKKLGFGLVKKLFGKGDIVANVAGAANGAPTSDIARNSVVNTVTRNAARTSKSQVNNTSIKIDAPVTVENGGDPDVIRKSVTESLQKGIDKMLRDTANANIPQVAF